MRQPVEHSRHDEQRGGDARRWRAGLAAGVLGLAVGLAGCGGSGGDGGVLEGFGSGAGNQAQNNAVAQIPPTPDTMRLVSVEPNIVTVLGSGQNQTSVLTFDVRDAAGRVVDDVCVSFALTNGGLGGGEVLQPNTPNFGSCTSLTVDGEVSTIFRAGTVAGTANVVAYIDADQDGVLDPTEIQAQATVGVGGGPPSGRHLGLAVEFLNQDALDRSGVTNEVTAFLADRFTNPVPPGTAVTFKLFDAFTLGTVGEIETGGVTVGDSSFVSATARSQQPKPTQGLIRAIGFAQAGADATVTCLLRPDPTLLPGTIFAGTDGGGVWKTTNFGANWTHVGTVSRGLVGGFVEALAVDPSNRNRVFAATSEGVYESLGGVSWFEIGNFGRIEGEDVTANVVASNPANTVYGVSSPLRSYARTQVFINGFPTRAFNIDFNNQRIRLFRTPPAGATITVSYDLGGQLPLGGTTAIEVDPVGRIYVGTESGGVFRSTDGGRTFLQISTGLSDSRVQDLALDSATGALYAATRGGGVFRNATPAAAGSSWTQLLGTGANLLEDGDVTSVSVLPGGGLLAIGTRSAGVQLSADQGANWFTPGGAGAGPFRAANDTEVSSVRVIDADTVVVTTLGSEDPTVARGGVWVSNNANLLGAATFVRRVGDPAANTGLPSLFAYDALADATATEILVATRGRSVARSTDGGLNFTEIRGSLPDRIGNDIRDGQLFSYSASTIFQVIDDPWLWSGVTSATDYTPATFSFGDIPAGEFHGFRIEVRDRNGVPLEPGTTLNVALAINDPTGNSGGATLSGAIEATLDSTFFSGEGTTDFFVSVTNNNGGGPAGVSGTLTANVVSPNGDAIFVNSFGLPP